MGQLKRLIPKNTRHVIAEKIDDKLPEGRLRQQSANLISAAGAGMVFAEAA